MTGHGMAAAAWNRSSSAHQEHSEATFPVLPAVHLPLPLFAVLRLSAVLGPPAAQMAERLAGFWDSACQTIWFEALQLPGQGLHYWEHLDAGPGDRGWQLER
eukprot:CAMPEP_0202390008 /NCGR_PEP_ID=MMETSP1127-20130417/86258_1 /ASSEMBLY_ACC=CAM_ASM_000462 /TAXON_ID=3047 /ORGANISM="Dunaliella tertiolecta, Strain CCMP1320" /LENGTH=101 /DNA_ID=CAMNT_0048991997 /DNA_START=51 /DNA_END=355 /DNA_ORIENTATION=-